MMLWGLPVVAALGLLTFTAGAAGETTLAKVFTVPWTLYCGVAWLMQCINRGFGSSYTHPNGVIVWWAIGLAATWSARFIRGGHRSLEPTQDANPLE
jgi:hypothetical protein